MRHSILIAIFSLFFLACNKDKFSSTPKLTYKSVNTTVLESGQRLTFTLGFTDQEGDVDSMFVKEINTRCPASIPTDTLYQLPEFPATKRINGEIFVSFGYRIDADPAPIVEPQCGNNDTCYFQFVIKDKKQNKSDTVNSEQIVIIKY